MQSTFFYVHKGSLTVKSAKLAFKILIKQSLNEKLTLLT